MGEEDEVSISDIVAMVTEAMEFKGEIIVSSLCVIMIIYKVHKLLCEQKV